MIIDDQPNKSWSKVSLLVSCWTAGLPRSSAFKKLVKCN